MHDDLWNEGKEEVLEQAQSESECCPVVSVFQNLQCITVVVNLIVEAHLLECLHWDLVAATVLDSVGLILEGEVVFNGETGQLGLLVLAGAERGGQIPEADEDRSRCDQAEEDRGLESATNLPGQICWDHENETEHSQVREVVGTRAISRQRGILDGGILQAEY